MELFTFCNLIYIVCVSAFLPIKNTHASGSQDLFNFTLSFSASSTMLGAPVFNEYLLNNRNLVSYVRSPQKLAPKQGYTSKLLTWVIILEVPVGGGKGEREDWRTAGTVSVSELFTPGGNWGSILPVLCVGHS